MRLRYFATSLLMFAIGFLLSPSIATCAQDNKIMGQIDFEAASKPSNNAGFWIDGQYLGYVSELKGDKKVLLLPGDHEVIARQTGYEDFKEKVTARAG